MNYPLKPTSDRLLIQIVEEKDIRKGDIEIVRERLHKFKAKVLDTGPGTPKQPMEIQPGDQIVFHWFENCKDFTHNGEKYAVIRTDNVYVYWTEGTLGEAMQRQLESNKQAT